MPNDTHARELVRFVRYRVDPTKYDDVEGATPEQLAVKVLTHTLDVLVELDCNWDDGALTDTADAIHNIVVDELAEH